MTKIVDGPSEWNLINPRNRKRIILLLENNLSLQVVTTNMELKSGTGHVYTFSTERGATGEYDARSKKGEIEYQETTKTETTPAIGAQ